MATERKAFTLEGAVYHDDGAQSRRSDKSALKAPTQALAVPACLQQKSRDQTNRSMMLFGCLHSVATALS